MAGCSIDDANYLGSDTLSVCELFCGDRESEAFDFLRQHAETPLQVSFYYLHLIMDGKVDVDAARPGRPTAEQVELAYRAILQRPAEDGTVVSRHVDLCDNLNQLIVALLTSQEAISRMPLLHARAFPLARRVWHVHIPKTAGTSFFTAAVESDWAYVNTNMLAGAVGNLKRVAAGVRLSPTTYVRTIISGHWHLLQYLERIDPFDHVVIFVRDPVECVVSEFNYAVDVVNRCSNVHSADPQPFLDRGLDPESFTNTFDRGYFACNPQCSYLSADATCASALKNLATCHADLLPSHAMCRAISNYFPNAVHDRVNVSNKHVRSTDIHYALREKIITASSQDFLLNEIAEMRYLKLAGRRRPAGPRDG